MGLSLLPTRSKKRFPRASGQGLLPLLGNHLLWKSAFLCWQLQAPVCSDPLQLKFKQSLQFPGGSVFHKMYSLADSDCEQLCIESAEVLWLSSFLLTLLRGCRQGHILHPLSPPTVGSSTLRKQDRSPLFPAPVFRPVAELRSSVDSFLNPSHAQVSNASLSWLQINQRVCLVFKNITVQYKCICFMRIFLTGVNIFHKFYFFLKSMWMLQVSDKLLLISRMNRSNRNVRDNAYLSTTLFFEYFFLKLKKSILRTLF